MIFSCKSNELPLARAHTSQSLSQPTQMRLWQRNWTTDDNARINNSTQSVCFEMEIPYIRCIAIRFAKEFKHSKNGKKGEHME